VQPADKLIKKSLLRTGVIRVNTLHFFDHAVLLVNCVPYLLPVICCVRLLVLHQIDINGFTIVFFFSAPLIHALRAVFLGALEGMTELAIIG
jgi:hypothetical protein